jgi:hypothetical protein
LADKDHPDRVDVRNYSDRSAAHLTYLFPGEPMSYRATISLLEDGGT